MLNILISTCSDQAGDIYLYFRITKLFVNNTCKTYYLQKFTIPSLSLATDA